MSPSHPPVANPAADADAAPEGGPLAWLGAVLLVAGAAWVAAAAVHAWRPTAPGDDVAASLGGAAGPAGPASPAGPGVLDAVTLTRGPCMGACPVYSLTVQADGQVRFDGMRHTCQAGPATAVLPAADARALLAAVRDAGVATAPDYTHVDMTDAPTLHLSTAAGTQRHVVTHYLGMRDVPEALLALEARIDAVAQARHWLPGRDRDTLTCADGGPLRDGP